MTEANNSPAVADVVEQTSDTAKTEQPAAPRRARAPLATTLSVLAIIIALALAGGSWYWNQRQFANQQTASQQLAAQLDSLQTQQRGLQQDLQSLIQHQQSQQTAQQTAQQQASEQTTALLQHLAALQQKVALISGANANSWLLAQADFLVKMAGRKLWSDEDIVTAIALLKSADTSLADMHDPSLISARRAITADIASISALNQVDYDGIILQLNQLASQVDNLRLADNPVSDETNDNRHQLSSSLQQWRQNLLKSWHSFMDSFITIRRRDATAVPLLAPDQEIYLRENIRSRLLIAAQAVPRHQQEIYRQSLENVSTWIRAYYNTDDAATKAFLANLDQLSQQTITMNLPESLHSQSVLDKLVQSRIYGTGASTESDSQGEQE